MDSALWQRREPREAAPTALQGVPAPWPRTSMEPRVLAVEGVAPKAVRAMPSCISAGTWHAERLWPQPWPAVETDLGAEAGVLRVDGSEVPKHGRHGAGVPRHDGGERGQRAHGEAGVWVGDGSPPGDTGLDRRLSVPVEWLTDEADAERRRPCGIPPASTLKTKPALAQEMLAAIVQTRSRRCRGVVADAAPGGDGLGNGLNPYARSTHSESLTCWPLNNTGSMRRLSHIASGVWHALPHGSEASL